MPSLGRFLLPMPSGAVYAYGQAHKVSGILIATAEAALMFQTENLNPSIHLARTNRGLGGFTLNPNPEIGTPKF